MADQTLTFYPDNPCNTIISADDGEVVYQVRTTYEPRTVTTVRTGEDDVIGSFEWRDVRSDVITFGSNGLTVPSSDWLKKTLMPFKDTVTFQDHRGKCFKWKGNSPGLQLELFSQDDKHQPVARFIKSHRILDKSTNPPTQETVPATLLLDPRAVEIRDEVLLSFLVLEKSRRTRESSTMNRADVLASPAMSKHYGLRNGGV